MKPHAMEEVLSGRDDSYLLPFFWQHGADESTLRHGMNVIRSTGIREVCIESRPHPDFCGPRWWRDMDIILDEAQKLAMRVWVLDDKQFPTGFAGGLIVSKYPEHHRRFLRYYAIDVMGPEPHASFLIDPLVVHDGGQLEAVVIGRRLDEGADWAHAKPDLDGLQDVTEKVMDGVLSLPIPEGLYSVVVVYSAPDRQIDLLNPISRAAVACQIEGCYEPHARHYAHLFGKTFAGFFSDEPQFANGGWNSLPGKDIPYPFSEELREALTEMLGADYRRLLPTLWLDGDASTAVFRYAYMDTVSRLYGEIMCGTLGDWCHRHGLLYIGHQVEDNNSHGRLGSGPGHFFRAQSAQDFAGMDIVMHQIHPGYAGISRHWHSGHTLTDGEFFHFALAKLASSAARLDEKKKGRALCENFGAYGWMEGTRLMKFLADHCLVRGINRFTPHAFTDSRFPEWDSPPHFYAQGHNPQFRNMAPLFRYMNRMCHLFDGGVRVTKVMVLYHADAEWWGEAMLSQKPMRVLMEHQIDFDVLPCDAFSGDDWREYRALVIPSARALPASFRQCLDVLAESGVDIWYIDRKPERTTDGRPCVDWPGKIVSLDGLSARLEEYKTVCVSPAVHSLRAMHYEQGEQSFFMLMNEAKNLTVEFDLSLPEKPPYGRYDGMNNVLYRQESDGRKLRMSLRPCEAVVLTAGIAVNACSVWKDSVHKATVIPGPWRISVSEAEDYPEFAFYTKSDRLFDVNSPEHLPRFSGTIRYEAQFETPDVSGAYGLILNDVYEQAQVWVNGTYAGLCVAEPYRYDLTGLIRQGKNALIIEVTNTLAKQQMDFSSAIVPQEPGGLLSEPKLIRWRN